jgi:oligopeptide/dipeptide ABC transporter ATP-binding protein
VDGVDFLIRRNETLGVVGESGCGKSVTALSIMQLVDAPGKIEAGEILFEGADLRTKSRREIHHIRGNRISMVFQEPMTSLNPVHTIGDQITEAIIFHQKLDKKEAMRKAVQMLDLVGIPDPAQRIREHPYQLSGGMRQRVMIAMSLSSEPDLLIADEPTTALDVTIQAQILELMRDLKERVGTAILLITHDLAVIAEVADSVAVMYAGRIIEKGPVREVFRRPLHPYAQGLLASIPRLDQPEKELASIPGSVPNLLTPPPGCRFHPRCPYAMPICKTVAPPMTVEGPDHSVACYLYQGPVATP